MDKEGYIKFHCNWLKTEPIAKPFNSLKNRCETAILGSNPEGRRLQV
jgi:hypothetical protein